MEPLTNSLSHIKLEEKTVVGLVDLTEDDETTLNASNSLIERHDKWLNKFQQLAKQSRDSQLLLEKQNQMISQASVICLDSDSEGEEDEHQHRTTTPAQLSTTTEITDKRTRISALSNQCEDLFVDSYPLTQTPINCDTDLESLDAEEDGEDVTKISSRFLSANLRTYQVKKSKNNILSDERNNTDCDQEPQTLISFTKANISSNDNSLAYRRDSIHISSTHPENDVNDEEDVDDGTDVQDDNEDDDLVEVETVDEEINDCALGKSGEDVMFAKQTKPIDLYPTYNNNNSNENCDKVGFSETLQDYSHQKHEQLHQLDKKYCSDSCEAKLNEKQKMKAQLNSSILGTTTTSNLSMKEPPVQQQSKYKLTDPPESFNLGGFESCSMEPNISVQNLTSINNDANNIKQKSMKNVKINLKKLRLSSDGNTLSKAIKKQETLLHTNSQTLSTNNNLNINNDSNSSPEIYKQTESCILKTSPYTSFATNEDDLIFKKPLPVSKKVHKSQKISTTKSKIKIQKVVSLRKYTPYYVKPIKEIKPEPKDNEELMAIELSKDCVKQTVEEQNINKEIVKAKQKQLLSKDNVTEMDVLAKISKLLTEEINNLTGNEIDEEVLEMNKETLEEEKKQEQEKQHEMSLNLEMAEARTNEVVNKEDARVEQDKGKASNNIENKEKELESNNSLHVEDVDFENLQNVNQSIENVDVNPIPSKENECNKEVLQTGHESGELKSSENLRTVSESKTETTKENTKEFSKEIDQENETNDNHDQSKYEDYNNSTNEIHTKDGETLKNSQINEKEIAEKKLNSTIKSNIKDSNECKEICTKDKEAKSEDQSTEIIKTINKSVTNFCAEYLAGLPNETSSTSLNDAVENESNANEVDFEFENNCSTTPTIDLENMNENTSDVPETMSPTQLVTDKCEADKLLEDFNHRTEDIVGTILNKKIIDLEELKQAKMEEDKKKSLENVGGKENRKRSRDQEDSVDNKEESQRKLMKKPKDKMETTEECLETLKISKHSLSTAVENVSIKTLEVSQIENTKQMFTYSENVGEKEMKIITPQPFKEQEPRTHKKSKCNFSDKNSCSSKKSKKIQKHAKKQEMTTSLENETLKEQRHKEEEHSPEHKETSSHQHMAASLNENQHMTVELGNWQQDLQTQNKTNDSESAGVSAIFSFPKIPIISISICTTPNNKTYFKISNRENDKKSTKETNKTSKTKDHEIAIAKTPAESCMETIEGDKCKDSTQDQLEVCNEDEEDEETEIDQEDEEEEEDEDEETDNLEIEKFSHDSNSACSLPLKKRPTQAEPNEETDDSQHIVAAAYEQAEDIAAEVVIEDSVKDKTEVIDENNVKEHKELQEVSKLEKKEEVKEQIKESATNTQVLQQCNESSVLHNQEIEDNKPSTSAASFKKLTDVSSPFKRRVHIPIRPIGQPPIQIVAPQLKDNTSTTNQDHRSVDTQIPTVNTRMPNQNNPLPESYPATPMLSVANVEKLMDFNRFIEDLLASPDVMTIIDNANACGYYAEGQAYEMERIAILEHYNIANAKGNTSVTKPLYWKKSAGDTISIFNDNDNEWIALPPSTAKQLLKLSFVLSILQQQYKVSDVRQRINIALTFLIQTSYSSKFKNNTNASNLQQRMQMYSRNIAEQPSTSHGIQQALTNSYFRHGLNNEQMNSNFNLPANFETIQDYASTTTATEMTMQQDSIPSTGSNHTWNNLMQFSNNTTMSAATMESTNSTNSPQRSDYEQQPIQEKQQRNAATWEDVNNEQLYIHPPCATSPQNEVIVNTNGVQLHEMPQDQQNIFISITDETAATNANAESATHKYNTRQQQQHFRTLEDMEHSSLNSTSTPSSSSSQLKRSCLAVNQQYLQRTTLTGNQDLQLPNSYRLQQQQQSFGNTNLNSNNYQPLNLLNNSRLNTSTQQTMPQQQRMSTRYSSSSLHNTHQQQQQQSSATPQPTVQSKVSETNYKEILQPYITYLIRDHEKTSKHLLQVFEEVSNSHKTSLETNNFNRNLTQQQQQQFHSLLPPLIRNPQQNHMPGLHQTTAGQNATNILPTLIRNPHQQTSMSLSHRDSGALQVVQSFLEQTQTSEQRQQEQQNLFRDQTSTTSSSITNPAYAKEYINFVDTRDDVVQKTKLLSLTLELQQQQEKQQQELQRHQDIERLNSVKRKCQERNDKLAEDLKRKMMEFSMLKHNVQTKLLAKQLQGQVTRIQNSNINNKKRGRPKKMSINTSSNREASSPSDIMYTNRNRCRSNSRQMKRKLSNSPTSNSTPTPTDHAYFRQRSAAREAAKRINASVNNQ